MCLWQSWDGTVCVSITSLARDEVPPHVTVPRRDSIWLKRSLGQQSHAFTSHLCSVPDFKLCDLSKPQTLKPCVGFPGMIVGKPGGKPPALPGSKCVRLEVWVIQTCPSRVSGTTVPPPPPQAHSGLTSGPCTLWLCSLGTHPLSLQLPPEAWEAE